MRERRWSSMATQCSRRRTHPASPSSEERDERAAMLRVAVIGVGHLGQHHARILAAAPDVTLVGVVDTQPGRADEIGSKYGVSGYTDVSDLYGRVDAVTVAVPTVAHVEVALPFIERGVAVL